MLKAHSATNLGLKLFLDSSPALPTVLGISVLENHMVLERHLKNFCQRHTVMCWYEEECFSFETAEPWLKNKQHHSLYPSVLRYILR